MKMTRRDFLNVSTPYGKNHLAFCVQNTRSLPESQWFCTFCVKIVKADKAL